MTLEQATAELKELKFKPYKEYTRIFISDDGNLIAIYSEHSNYYTIYPKTRVIFKEAIEEETIDEKFLEDYDLGRFEDQLQFVLDKIKKELLEKNSKYGNSLQNPLKVFYKGKTIDGIYARLDDKLSRLRNQNPEEDEDVENDLIGYLIQLQIHKQFYKEK